MKGQKCQGAGGGGWVGGGACICGPLSAPQMEGFHDLVPQALKDALPEISSQKMGFNNSGFEWSKTRCS